MLTRQLQQAKSLLNQFRSGPNMQFALNNFCMNNPQIRNVMNYVQNEYKGDAKQAFYAYANKIGINPDEFIQQLQN